MTMRADIIEVLKKGWHSNLEIIKMFNSAGADRVVRSIRENPPLNYRVLSRKKQIEGYRDCLEFTLARVNDDKDSN